MAKADLKIDWATHEAAKYACENWHYSRCLPVGKLVKIGAWENGKFIGVVLFGRGTAKDLGTRFGLGQSECVELTRVAFNRHRVQISRILKIAIKFLRDANPGLRLIVSFAAQSEGHHGGIYQAQNWIYEGESKGAKEVLYKGKRLTDRAFAQMVVNSKYTMREWIDNGWVSDVRSIPKHRYLMPLDAEMREKIEPLAKPYPKREKQAMASSPEAQRRGSTDLHAP